MKSMTGYGEGSAQDKRGRVVVQMRTLNHRHLDIQARIPREYYPFEEDLRQRIRARIARGRVELFVHRFFPKHLGRQLEVDENLLGQYVTFLRRAKGKFGLGGEVDVSLFAQPQEFVRVKETYSRGENEKDLVFRALDSALKQLDRSREREGRQLLSDIRSQIRSLESVSSKIGEAGEKIHATLNQGRPVGEVRSAGKDQGEWANGSGWSTKGDIHEETVRLRSHVRELARLVRSRQPVGKRLDFLLQEIQRELNTVSSKVSRISIVRWVVSGKERVEKIREQAQNVE